VIGCVYVYPSDDADAEVWLWVRGEAWQEGLDAILEERVRGWIGERWPFARVAWPERGERNVSA